MSLTGFYVHVYCDWGIDTLVDLCDLIFCNTAGDTFFY